MREELRDAEVEEVAGGSVVLSVKMGIVGFSNLGKSYKILGDYKKMRNLMFQIQDEAEGSGMTPLEFDTKVRDEFQKRGWI